MLHIINYLHSIISHSLCSQTPFPGLAAVPQEQARRWNEDQSLVGFHKSEHPLASAVPHHCTTIPDDLKTTLKKPTDQ